MDNFKKALEKKISQSLKNNYGRENYDEFRFGKYPVNNTPQKAKAKLTGFQKTKNRIKKIIGYNPDEQRYIMAGNNLIEDYSDGIQKIWDNISNIDRELLISLFAYKILGYRKVKLPRNNIQYWEAIKTANALANPKDTYDPHFMHFILEKFNLKSIGYDVEFYFSQIGVAIDFIIEQYAYKIGDNDIVSVKSGDTVLDLGACWGDTALYFANKAGKDGKVYSFEFIPDNIKLFELNKNLNPGLVNQIELVPNPVSNKSGDVIYFKDNGPGSKVSFEPFEGQSGTTTTISIDDFVKSNSIDKIDFIKMDIEGAEPMALEGAIETIKRFRPKLAIAIYHSMDDLINIPNWILNLDLDYEIFINHYTIHLEETICFAIPRKR